MSTPLVRLDPESATPAYEQIRAQIAGGVDAGALTAGQRLPTVRGLAADLGVAVNTVARAYRELEAGGVILTQRRLGTVVADGVRPSTAAVAVQARAFAQAVVDNGLDDGTALDLVRTALRTMRSTGPTR